MLQEGNQYLKAVTCNYRLKRISYVFCFSGSAISTEQFPLVYSKQSL